MSSPTPDPPGQHVATAAATPSAAPVGRIVAVLALAGIAVSLMQTLVIPIVSELPALLGSTAANTAWAVTATLLAGAIVTPIAGRLGDMIGKRPLLMVSLAMMVIGSVVCALADSLVPLVVGRALQGFAAGVIPLGISLMRDVLPAERVGPSTALMSASLGVGGALGLPAAALIADNFNWHVLFWVAAGLGAVVLLLVATLIPGTPRRPGGRLDVVGALGLSGALVGLLLGVSKGSAWGWTSGRTLALLSGGVLLALLWGRYELRTKQPLVDLRTTAKPQVLLTNLASLLFGFSLFAMSLVFPQLIQLPSTTGYGLGKSMLVAGLAMIPSGLVMMIGAGISSKITATYGAKVSLMIGALITSIGYVLGIVMMGAVWQLSIVSGVIGLGIGFAYGALPALIMSAVPVTETASANSFNTLIRSVGTSVSSAVAGAVLAASATTLGGVSVPSQNGFRTILGVAAGTALVALLIAACIPGRQRVDSQLAPAAAIASDSLESGAPRSGAEELEPALPEPALQNQHDTHPVPAASSLPTSTWEVRGTVHTDAVRPLAGAVVTIADSAGRQIARAATGAAGEYHLTVPVEGSYLVVVAAPSLSPRADLVAVDGNDVVHDVTLTGRAALSGQVLGRSASEERAGTPARLTLIDTTGRVVASATTDDLGNFAFCGLAGGSYVLSARGPVGRPIARQVVADGDTEVFVELVLTRGPL